MANPLQPKCVKILEYEYNAFVVIATGTTKSGIMDIIAGVPMVIEDHIPVPYYDKGYGSIVNLFYGFEIKWGQDTPTELQKQKINELIDKGGRGYFVRSEEELRKILDEGLKPQKYKLKNKIIL